MRYFAVPVLLFAALGWTGAVGAQGGPTSRVTQEDVVELQWRAFREYSVEQRDRGAAIDDAAQTLGVDRIFARLLTVAWKWFPDSRSLRWEVLLTADDSVEARAYPSGQIIVAKPFISRFVRSEDELAFVLAHEMAHVLQQHGRLGYERAVAMTRLAGPVDARLIDENLKSSLALRLRLYPLMRAQESEADRMGEQLAVSAGFAQAAGAALLERMAENGDDSSPTHDSLHSRSAALRPPLFRD